MLAAYGWAADIADDDLLERLLALNFTREPAEAGPAGVLAGNGDDEEDLGVQSVRWAGASPQSAWAIDRHTPDYIPWRAMVGLTPT